MDINRLWDEKAERMEFTTRQINRTIHGFYKQKFGDKGKKTIHVRSTVVEKIIKEFSYDEIL